MAPNITIYGTDPFSIYGTDPFSIYGTDPFSIYGTDPFSISSLPRSRQKQILDVIDVLMQKEMAAAN